MYTAKALFTNYPLMCAVVGWFAAQICKIFTGMFRERSFDVVTVLFGTGGMPSSHTATVIALSASIGMHNGWDSDIFAVAGIFAFIVMFDAIKVRLPIEKLTDAFNLLQDKFYGKDVSDVKKVEGHTLPEIAGGFVVGASIAYFMVRVLNFLG